MNRSALLKSAEFIAKRNVSEQVNRVIVTFDENTSHLSILYCLDGDPSDTDRDDCELTCAELIAEFPDIETADTACIPIQELRPHVGVEEDLVFLRK